MSVLDRALSTNRLGSSQASLTAQYFTRGQLASAQVLQTIERQSVGFGTQVSELDVALNTFHDAKVTPKTVGSPSILAQKVRVKSSDLSSLALATT